jgi:hypothetical protein
MRCNNGVCTTPGDLGNACVASSECNAGLHCTATSEMPTGVCAIPLANAASCAVDGDCQSEYCLNNQCATRPICVP